MLVKANSLMKIEGFSLHYNASLCFCLFHGVTRELNSDLRMSQELWLTDNDLITLAEIPKLFCFCWFYHIFVVLTPPALWRESYHREVERPEWWSSAPSSSVAWGEKKQKKLWNKIMCWYVERGIECFSHTECYVTCQNLTSDNCMLGWAWPLPVWEWGNHRVNMENKRRCINTGKLPVGFYPRECSSDSTAGE